MLAVKSCSKSTVIKTGLTQHTNGIDQHLYGNFVNESDGNNTSQWRKDELFNKHHWDN